MGQLAVRGESLPLRGRGHEKPGILVRSTAVKPHIHVMFTGGTISMKIDPATAAAVPALSGRDIVSHVPGLRRVARLTLEDYARLPGPHVGPLWMWGLKKRNTVFAIGKSIFDRGSKTHIGNLCLEYGGGGHDAAGTCQVENEKADEVLGELIKRINADG